MTHILYEIACNPKLPLETRYRIARYLQRQRKKQKKHEDYVKYRHRGNVG